MEWGRENREEGEKEGVGGRRGVGGQNALNPFFSFPFAFFSFFHSFLFSKSENGKSEKGAFSSTLPMVQLVRGDKAA